MNPIRGVLFDLDGTLVDSIDLIVACFDHTYHTHLGATLPRERIVATIGRPLIEALEDAAPGRGSELFATYGAFNDAHHDDLLRPYPAALDAARALHARGLPLGVVTSKRRAGTRCALRLYDVESIFPVLVALEDTPRHKPAPDPLLEGARRLGLVPADTLYVGDSVYDVQAARAAGMPVAAVLWGAGTAGELRDLTPDLLLAEPRELLTTPFQSPGTLGEALGALEDEEAERDG